MSNYLNRFKLNSETKSTDVLLGKYKDAIFLPDESTSVEFLQSSRNQRYERDYY